MCGTPIKHTMWIYLTGVLVFISFQGSGCWPHGLRTDSGDKESPVPSEQGAKLVVGVTDSPSQLRELLHPDSYLKYAIHKSASVAVNTQTPQKAIKQERGIPARTEAGYFQPMNQDGRHSKNARKKPVIQTNSKEVYSSAAEAGLSSEYKSIDRDSGVQFARLQENRDSDSDSNASYSAKEMVLTIATAVAALFTMGLLTALFGCCCRKKRQTDVNDNGDSKKGSKKSSSAEPQVNEDGTANHSDLAPADDTGSPVSVRDKIKALETHKLPLKPSPDLSTHAKKRPETEAFKAFEDTGVLIGMGRVPQITVTEKTDSDDDVKPVLPESESRDKDADISDLTTDNTSIHSSTSQPHNPDVIVADVELDEFADVQRETEVLKSFRRAKPPRNRSPATRNSHRKLRQKSQANLPKQEEEKSEQEKVKVTPVSQEDKENISLAVSSVLGRSDKTDSASKQGPERKTPSPRPLPKPRSPSKQGLKLDSGPSKRHSGYTEHISNIFYLIDPTVKNKCLSMGDVTATKLNTESSPTKTSPEDNQDPDLVKALNQQIKASRKDNQDSPTEDSISPVPRERTRSDPSKKRNSKVVEQTAL